MSAADRAIRISTATAVLGVAGIAAYVSYWHAYEVVRAHGESGVTARLEPATIDGLVYASSMVVLYAARPADPHMTTPAPAVRPLPASTDNSSEPAIPDTGSLDFPSYAERQGHACLGKVRLSVGG